MLENELDEKEQLQVMCQRLKDEVRGTAYDIYALAVIIINPVDLRQDMNTQTRKPKTGSPEAVRSDREVSQVITRHATPSGKTGDFNVLLLCYVCSTSGSSESAP